MPGLTPTAAPEAPPLPLRGEGMGVGGHFRRVRIHGAPWLALAITLTTQAAAQVIPTGTPAADILLSQAIAEHRVFLTCSALDPATHAQILADWQRDTTAAVTILKTHNTPPEAITAFHHSPVRKPDARPRHSLGRSHGPLCHPSRLADQLWSAGLHRPGTDAPAGLPVTRKPPMPGAALLTPAAPHTPLSASLPTGVA